MNRREKPHATRTPTRRQSRHPTSDHVPIWRSRLQPRASSHVWIRFATTAHPGSSIMSCPISGKNSASVRYARAVACTSFGVTSVTFRTQYKKRRRYPLGFKPVRKDRLQEGGRALFLQLRGHANDLRLGRMRAEKASRASVGVFNPGNCLPVMAALSKAMGAVSSFVLTLQQIHLGGTMQAAPRQARRVTPGTSAPRRMASQERCKVRTYIPRHL